MYLCQKVLTLFAVTFSLFLTALSEAKPTALRILTENWPPVSYEENGKPQGMAVELVQSMQSYIGSQSSAEPSFAQPIEVVPWARAYKFLQDVPNTLLFSVIRTAEREKIFTMLGPIARGNISVFSLTKPKKSFATSKEMKEKAVIAVTRGTAFESTLRNHNYKNIFDVRDAETAVRLLAAGRVDYICDDSLAIQDIFRKLQLRANDFKTVQEIETYDLYLGFSPGTDSSTLHTWKKSLEALKKNGQFAAIYRKWFNNLKPPAIVEVIGLGAKPPEKTVEKKTVEKTSFKKIGFNQ